PYHAPSYGHHYCDPKAPPACANASGLAYCLDDPYYPEYELKSAISADYLFAKKYSDIVDQSANDLVELIAKEQEEGFNYDPYDASHWIGPEGYLCPSDVKYAMPRRASNVNGEWRVIVNHVHYYTQTTRFETCLFPDSACRLLAPCYKSKCTQKYVYQRMSPTIPVTLTRDSSLTSTNSPLPAPVTSPSKSPSLKQSPQETLGSLTADSRKDQ
ncbi:Putative LOC101740088, partial [Caligus rogercresseyi]